jgi:mono/diheme cytochrome c family protein
MIPHPGVVSTLLPAAALLWPVLLAAQGREAGPKLGATDYEGWRQYSAHCARCHGQDVVGNPVAANLLESAGPGGPVAGRDAFVEVVKAGRPSGGMPGFAKQLTDEQISAIYAYVKGRADKKIPAGRPEQRKP